MKNSTLQFLQHQGQKIVFEVKCISERHALLSKKFQLTISLRNCCEVNYFCRLKGKSYFQFSDPNHWIFHTFAARLKNLLYGSFCPYRYLWTVIKSLYLFSSSFTPQLEHITCLQLEAYFQFSACLQGYCPNIIQSFGILSE